MASERPPYASSSGSPPLGAAQEADEYDSPLFKSDEFRLVRRSGAGRPPGPGRA